MKDQENHEILAFRFADLMDHEISNRVIEISWKINIMAHKSHIQLKETKEIWVVCILRGCPPKSGPIGFASENKIPWFFNSRKNFMGKYQNGNPFEKKFFSGEIQGWTHPPPDKPNWRLYAQPKFKKIARRFIRKQTRIRI